MSKRRRSKEREGLNRVVDELVESKARAEFEFEGIEEQVACILGSTKQAPRYTDKLSTRDALVLKKAELETKRRRKQQLLRETEKACQEEKKCQREVEELERQLSW